MVHSTKTKLETKKILDIGKYRLRARAGWYYSVLIGRESNLNLKVNTSKSPPYNPQSNHDDGKNENHDSHWHPTRSRFLLKIIEILCEKDPTDWVHAGRLGIAIGKGPGPGGGRCH